MKLGALALGAAAAGASGYGALAVARLTVGRLDVLDGGAREPGLVFARGVPDARPHRRAG